MVLELFKLLMLFLLGLFKDCISTQSQMSCIYGLRNIHKPDAPLPPIVSTIGSVTYNLAKHLARIISPLVGQTASYIKNSAHFSEIINQRQVHENELMVSSDVTSLFTKVPHSIHDQTSLSISSLITCACDLLQLKWQILPTKPRCNYGLPSFSNHCQHFYRIPRKDSTLVSQHQTITLVALCRWHLYTLATHNQ